jgi:hypothetical protein
VNIIGVLGNVGLAAPAWAAVVIFNSPAFDVAAARAADMPEIGKTVAVKNKVTVEADAIPRSLVKGETVHQNEIVITEKAASAEIELKDSTKLAVGPSARIVLDKFVYDAGAEPGSISINMAKGAFRFITGASPKSAYEIKTPTVSLAVRGTVFDVYVDGDGETVVLLHEGEVDMCAAPGSCRRHNKVGHIVRVGVDRIITEPLVWTGSLMKGLAVGTVFPFVGRRLAIDPVRRLSRASLATGGAAVRQITRTPGRVVRGVGRTLRKFRPRF